MGDNVPDDSKAREASYSHILDFMANPTPELLDSLRAQLPRFLCDTNMTCQRLALNICDQFFKHSTDINYAEISDILIHHCFGNHPEHTMMLLETCFKADYHSVSPLIYENMTERSSEQIKMILAIVISHLATLSPREANEAEDIIKHITPLTLVASQKDESVRKEAIAAIDSAKIVISHRNGSIFNSSDNNGSADDNKDQTKSGDNWQKLLKSENWKERKEGYSILLNCLNNNSLNTNNNNNNNNNNDNTSFQIVDKDFFSAASAEKHVANMNIVLEIIENMTKIFKSQMQRRLREYITIIINILSQRKNPRLTFLQSCFDSFALNVVTSPYETPSFCEQLTKMMSSSNIRLKEEALLFIGRNSQIPRTSQINDILQKMTSDQSQYIREMASSLLPSNNSTDNNNNHNFIEVNNSLSTTLNGNSNNNNNNGNNNNNINSNNNDNLENNNNNDNDNSNTGNSRTTRSKSPEKFSLSRTFRKKNSFQTMQATWTNWVNPETLELLSSIQWLSVTKGLDLLRKQFDEESNRSDYRSSIVSGLTSLFTGRTFTPKVMSNLFQNVLFYLTTTANNEKINEECISSVINFCVDKIVDKHFESVIFDILEKCSEIVSSSSFILEALYPQMTNKNPVVVSKVVSFFAYHIEKNSNNNSNMALSFNDISNQIKPLLTHGDPTVRKAAQDLSEVLSHQNPNASNTDNNNLNNSPILTTTFNVVISKDVANSDNNFSYNNNNENNDNNSFSNNNNNNENNSHVKSGNAYDINETNLIPQKLINSVGKTSSILECRKGLEDLENLLTEALSIKGLNSYPNIEFSELFTRLRPWFKDSNQNIVFSVSKVVLLSLKLVIDVDNLSNEYLSDLVLLLNFIHKGIRTTTIQILDQLNKMKKLFIRNVFVPNFFRLNAGGRKAGIIFVRELDFDLQVDSCYTPFIVNILGDKSEDLRNAALPIVQKFLSFSGSEEQIINEVEQFPPAKKNLVISLMSGIEPDSESMSKFSKNSNNHNSSNNNNNMGNCSNNRCQTARDRPQVQAPKEEMGETVRPYTTNKKTIESPRKKKLSLTSRTKNNNNDNNENNENNDNNNNNNENNTNKSSIPVKKGIPVRKSEDSPPVRFRKVVDTHEVRRKSEDNSENTRSSIPILKNKGKSTQEAEFPINEPSPTSKKRSVNNISNCNTNNSNTNNNNNNNTNVVKFSNNTDVYNDISENDISNSNPSFSLNSSNNENNNFKQQQITTKISSVNEKGCCKLNDFLTQRISDPSIYVYQWIADLNSSDLNRISLSTKAILKHLKGNTSIFIIHIEALSASLIFKLHSFLLTNPVPESIVKTISLCMFHMLCDPKLYKKLPKEFIQQIIIEICVNFQIFPSEFNNLMSQLIESLPLFTFSSLLLAVGEFQSEWIDIPLKFLEKCGEKIILIGNTNNAICKSLLMVDKFFVIHPKNTILEKRSINSASNNNNANNANVGDYGVKCVKILENFISKIGESFTDIVNQKETMNKFPQNSTVLPLLALAPKKGAPTIPSTGGHPQSQLRTAAPAAAAAKPSSPLQMKIRIAQRPNT